jgi:DNA-binding transcriptional ArsR family regulator
MHPTRRLLVRACLEQPRAAGELVELAGAAGATVSEHLKVLRKTGLLVLDVQGRRWLYRTDAELLRASGEAVSALADA